MGFAGLKNMFEIYLRLQLEAWRGDVIMTVSSGLYRSLIGAASQSHRGYRAGQVQAKGNLKTTISHQDRVV